jgi:hypothetical protein
MWRMAILLMGCGRIGFDATTSTDAEPDGVPSSLAEDLPCDTPVLLDSGGHLPHDVLVWANTPHGDWLIGVEHVSQDVHRILRYPISLGATGLVAGAAELIAPVDHVDALRLEPVTGGYVLGYDEFVLRTGHALLLTPDLAVAASRPLGQLASGNPPLARAGNGGLAMIGLASSNLQVVAIGDGGAPTGVINQLATPTEGVGLPTMVAMADGLAAAWHSTARSTCRLATLHADLSLANGPIDMALGGCTDAHVAWLPASRRLIMVGDNAANSEVVGAVWDEQLGSIPGVGLTTVASSAHWGRIVDDGSGTGAWVAWVENGSIQKMRHAHLDIDGRVTAIGDAVGQLDASLGHYHTLQHVGQSTVAVWADTARSRTFAAMRLCH